MSDTIDLRNNPQTATLREGTSIQIWTYGDDQTPNPIVFDFQHAAQTISNNISVEQAEHLIAVLTAAVKDVRNA